MAHVDTRNDSTVEDLYRSFCGERTVSSVKSCLYTLCSKGFVTKTLYKKRAKYSVTDLGREVYKYWEGKRHVFWLKNPYPKTREGLCDQCRVFKGTLTRRKKGETDEGENTYEYLCRDCLCPDDDLSLEREVAFRSTHVLDVPGDFEVMSVGDVKAIQEAVKKKGRGFKIRFGRM